MKEYKFRIHREQWITRTVQADDRDEAFIQAGQGDGEDEPGDTFDTIVECLTPKRGRKPKGGK